MVLTPIYNLDLLVAAQSNAEGKVNDYAKSLEQGALSFRVTLDTLLDPPASPANGEAHIISGTPINDWSTFADKDIAYFTTGAGWRRIKPEEGMQAWRIATDTVTRFDGTNWGAGAALLNLTNNTNATGDDTVADGDITDSGSGTDGGTIEDIATTNNTTGTADTAAPFAFEATGDSITNDNFATLLQVFLKIQDSLSSLQVATVTLNANNSDLTDKIIEIRAIMRTHGMIPA